MIKELMANKDNLTHQLNKSILRVLEIRTKRKRKVYKIGNQVEHLEKKEKD